MLSEKHYATVGLSDPTGSDASSLVPSDDAINQEAVKKLISMGFSEAQATAIIANAKKKPAAVAAEAREAAKGYVESIASRAAVDKLMAAGFTEDEAKRVVASGRDVDALVANLKQIAVRNIEEAVVKQFIDKYGMEGLSTVEAQALALATSDPKEILKLLADPKKRADLLKAVNNRFKEAGIDLEDRATRGLSLTDSDKKTISVAIKAAQDAYKIFAGIESAVNAYAATGYFAGRWSEEVMSDSSLSALAATLQDLADQTEQDRLLRQQRMTEGVHQAISGVAGIAAAFGPYGMAVAVVLEMANAVIAAIVTPDVETDDNDKSFQADAKDAATSLWTQWQLVPPSFDTRYYTLRSYALTVGQQVRWLEESDKEVGPDGVQLAWREDFRKTIDDALHPPLDSDTVPTPVVDLAALGWIPFSFSDWAGGANYPQGSHWRGVPYPEFGGDGVIDLDVIQTSGEDIDDRLLVGAEGIVLGESEHFTTFFQAEIFNNKSATVEARNQYTPDPVTGWLGKSDPEGRGGDLGFIRWLFTYPRSFLMPRNLYAQRTICDRIAASIATMVAVTRGKPAEAIIEATVKASRQMIDVYGWQPRFAAQRLRDTFRTAVLMAEKMAPLKGVPKYSGFTRSATTVALPTANISIVKRML